MDDVERALERARPWLAMRPVLIASDFDGTLAHLVADPWGARIIPTAQRSLRRLAGEPGVEVALISGRTVADLAARARIGGIRYLGDHGSESAEAVPRFRPAALIARREPLGTDALRAVARLVRHVPERVPDAWLVVEDKVGAVTFHFRAAPDVAAARAAVLAAIDSAGVDGALLRSAGARAIELRAPGASTKGQALGQLIREQRPAAVLMLGDDPSDALAFDVLREQRARGRLRGLAIAVAGRPDVTRDVVPRADAVLAGPGHAARFLARLAAEVSAGRRRSWHRSTRATTCQGALPRR